MEPLGLLGLRVKLVLTVQLGFQAHKEKLVLLVILDLRVKRDLKV
jgi:hypothetical protein